MQNHPWNGLRTFLSKLYHDICHSFVRPIFPTTHKVLNAAPTRKHSRRMDTTHLPTVSYCIPDTMSKGAGYLTPPGHTHPIKYTHPREHTYPLDIPTPWTYPPPSTGPGARDTNAFRKDLVPEIPTPKKDMEPEIPTPLWTERLTDTCENITFPQLRKYIHLL